MNIEKFLKNKGIVRDKKQANGVMTVFIILCLIIIVLVSRKPNYDNNINDQSMLSAEEIELMELS